MFSICTASFAKLVCSWPNTLSWPLSWTLWVNEYCESKEIWTSTRKPKGNPPRVVSCLKQNPDKLALWQSGEKACRIRLAKKMKSHEYSILPSLLPIMVCYLYVSFNQNLESWNIFSWLRNCSKVSSILFSLGLMLKTYLLEVMNISQMLSRWALKKWGSIWIICQAIGDKKLFLTPAGMSDYFDNKLKQAWKLEITRIKLSPVNDWAPLFSTFSSILTINMSSSLTEIGSLLLATRGIYWVCGTNFQPDQEDNLFLMWVLSWELKNSLYPLWLLAYEANCNVQILNVRIFSVYEMFMVPNNF